ncbi:MAG: hypothetical protein V1707_03625 [bacterium]
MSTLTKKKETLRSLCKARFELLNLINSGFPLFGYSLLSMDNDLQGINKEIRGLEKDFPKEKIKELERL